MLRLKRFPAVVFILLATLPLMTQVTSVEAAPQECRTTPGSSGPAGGHWYYRIDRANQSRCWFLSSEDFHRRQANSLRHRGSITQGGEAGSARREPDNEIVAGPTPRQASVVVPDEQTHKEVGTTQFNLSEGLVPHKVTSISYPRPRAEGQGVRSGINFDSVFLCGTLATALVLAGGIFQLIGRLRLSSRALRQAPNPWQASAGVERQKISVRTAQYRSIPSSRIRQQSAAENVPRRTAQLSTGRLH
jgi:hypothetical protein